MKLPSNLWDSSVKKKTKPAFQGFFLAPKKLKTNKEDLHQVKCIWLLRFSSARGEVWAIAQMSKYSAKKGDM